MLSNQKSISYDELVLVARPASSLEDVRPRAMAIKNHYLVEPITDWKDFGRRPTSNIHKSGAFPTYRSSKIAYVDVIMA